jgi:uncharacterized protein DUF3892
MPKYQVTCISKVQHEGSREDVTNIGNIAQGWRMSRDEAIRLIESKLHEFYVEGPDGITSSLGVMREPARSPYLRTHVRGEWNDNLLLLPQCPP